MEKSILEGASEFVTTNVEGTQILLDAIRRTPVERFVLFSSSEVYGTAESEPMDEEHPLNPRSPYAATGGAPTASPTRTTSPTAADRDRAAVQHVRAVPAPGEAHPASRRRRSATRRSPSTATATRAATGCSSRTSPRRRGRHRSDLDAVAGEVINLATGRDLSVAEIADLVIETLGKPASLKTNVPERPGQVDRHIGSTEKASVSSAGRRRRSSRTASSRRSRGIATIGRGGSHRFALNRISKRLLVLGRPGPARSAPRRA